jgi:hypothetical protein
MSNAESVSPYTQTVSTPDEDQAMKMYQLAVEFALSGNTFMIVDAGFNCRLLDNLLAMNETRHKAKLQRQMKVRAMHAS